MFKKSILAIIAMAGAFLLPAGLVANDAADPVLTTLAATENKTWLEQWISDPTVVWTVVVLLIFLVLIIACFMYLKKLDS